MIALRTFSISLKAKCSRPACSQTHIYCRAVHLLLCHPASLHKHFWKAQAPFALPHLSFTVSIQRHDSARPWTSAFIFKRTSHFQTYIPFSTSKETLYISIMQMLVALFISIIPYLQGQELFHKMTNKQFICLALVLYWFSMAGQNRKLVGCVIRYISCHWWTLKDGQKTAE